MPSPMNKNTYLGAFADSSCCAAGCASGAAASCFGVSAAACVCAGCDVGSSVFAGAAEHAAMLSASAAPKIPLMIFFAFIGVSSLYYALRNDLLTGLILDGVCKNRSPRFEKFKKNNSRKD